MIPSYNRLARQVSLANYEHLPKPVLYMRLKEQFNFERLLRTEQRATTKGTSKGEDEASTIGKKRSSEEVADGSSSSSSSQGTSKDNKKAKLNSIDPIMLIPIGKKKTFKFTRPNGTMVQFLVDTLIDYMISSGEFSDPETRIPFSDSDLIELDKTVSIDSIIEVFEVIILMVIHGS